MNARPGDLPAAEHDDVEQAAERAPEPPTTASSPNDAPESVDPEPGGDNAPESAEPKPGSDDAPRHELGAPRPASDAPATPLPAAGPSASETEVLPHVPSPVRRPERDPFATAPIAAPVLVDDAPTDVFPAAAPASGRHRADADDDAHLVAEWRAPRETSRMTMVLLAALLVAIGFFAGVIVGRNVGTHTPAGDGARPAATGPARAGTLR